MVAAQGITAGALARLDHLVSTPGTEYRYCNAGYVCLAVIIERAASRPLPDFAREHVFAPLGMASSRYWPGPARHPPGAVPLDPHYPAPLSLGDGGVWSTATDLIRWNQALERDELGVSALLQTPGRLDDGTRLDYAWALGVREHAGRRIYRHGGRWARLSAARGRGSRRPWRPQPPRVRRAPTAWGGGRGPWGPASGRGSTAPASTSRR
ncbi:serine hydrolase domain-containing protein [Nonomuraea sp. B19D2]|uniref:serine hydrolase domain-containing protein n=1 Tax=Nonomuraea sp. B19D2 TaxID=3159561 RepID=UPI0032DAE5E5